MAATEPDRMTSAEGSSFPSTRWSLVLGAGCGMEAASEAALAELCRKYWYPLYLYVRRRGYRAEDAQDLTQQFFARFLERKYLGVADPGRGRFRSFLLKSLQYFVNDEWDRAQATKRGGGRGHLPWDAGQAEDRYAREPADNLTPERAFDRQWAKALLGDVLARLQQESIAAGKGEQFATLKVFLSDIDASAPYARVAERLAISESAARAAVWRLRVRYRELLLQEIAHTVASPGDVEQEVRDLFTAFE